MDWEVVAPMVVAIVLIVTTGTVVLLRPLAKRLGDLLETLTEQRQRGTAVEGLDTLRELLEHQGSRLDLLERKLDFTESLLDEREAPRITRETGE